MSNFIMCTKCQAVISTGTLGIFGPSAIIDEFHARIGGVIVEQYAVVSCNKTFPIKILIKRKRLRDNTQKRDFHCHLRPIGHLSKGTKVFKHEIGLKVCPTTCSGRKEKENMELNIRLVRGFQILCCRLFALGEQLCE